MFQKYSNQQHSFSSLQKSWHFSKNSLITFLRQNNFHSSTNFFFNSLLNYAINFARIRFSTFCFILIHGLNCFFYFIIYHIRSYNIYRNSFLAMQFNLLCHLRSITQFFDFRHPSLLNVTCFCQQFAILFHNCFHVVCCSLEFVSGSSLILQVIKSNQPFTFPIFQFHFSGI